MGKIKELEKRLARLEAEVAALRNAALPCAERITILKDGDPLLQGATIPQRDNGADAFLTSHRQAIPAK